MEWNFFIKGHGKSDCDRHFSHVNYALRQYVREGQQQDRIINTTDELVMALDDAMNRRVLSPKGKPTERISQTAVFMLDVVQPSSKSITEIKGEWLKCHHFIANSNWTISYKRLKDDKKSFTTKVLQLKVEKITRKVKMAHYPVVPIEEKEIEERTGKLAKEVHQKQHNDAKKKTLKEKFDLIGLEAEEPSRLFHATQVGIMNQHLADHGICYINIFSLY